MELKPCPFCGSTDVYVPPSWMTANTWKYVKCKNINCQAEGPVDLGESGAIERWNTRPGECAESSPTPKEMHT